MFGALTDRNEFVKPTGIGLGNPEVILFPIECWLKIFIIISAFELFLKHLLKSCYFMPHFILF